MIECDYCGETVGDEDAYRDHLAGEHADELSPVDRRRVEVGADDPDDPNDGLSRRSLLGGGAVVAGLAGLGVVAVTREGNPVDGLAAEPLPESGDDALLQGLEAHPADSTGHVDSVGLETYDESPPAAGPHHGGTVSAGFHAELSSLGDLVHTLEHGAVVDYYDPAALTDDAEESLRDWGRAYTDAFMSFVAVPTPVENPDHPHVLAAWERLLRLDGYDPAVVQAFCAEFIGRGPERTRR
ncbi:MAG: DUF3105 domain-containing protein [Halolamina sp.]